LADHTIQQTTQEMSMKLLTGLQKILMASTVTVLAFGLAPAAMADNTVNLSFGTCVGGVGSDCTTAAAHASISVVSTLSVNEQRAISFGNVSVSCGAGPCDGKASLVLALNGTRTASTSGGDTITPLHGAQSSNGAGNTGSGAQQPGHYTISGGNEGSSKQVYISFADSSGNAIDFSGDQYHPGDAVTLSGPAGHTFSMDNFVINESGSDVYGHYIDNDGDTVAPAIADPNNPAGGKFANNTAGVVDVVVGATLHTVAGAGTSYGAGKYVGTFNVMASY
jgi:hypothetical protein